MGQGKISLDWLTDSKIPVGKTAKAVFDWVRDNFDGALV